jgi:hypothetical protein
MAKPLRDLFAGIVPRRPAYQAIQPRWTFEHVVLPAATRRALSEALGQIQQHDLIFRRWGLGEKHASGLGLAFNFAGPPGTGKIICAEAIAHTLGVPLLVVRYAELESMWAGETAKNVRAVFEAAQQQNAVLFFDEADAIASRRFASANEAYAREANIVVNVLLQELEAFNGVIVFATNLPAISIRRSSAASVRTFTLNCRVWTSVNIFGARNCTRRRHPSRMTSTFARWPNVTSEAAVT